MIRKIINQISSKELPKWFRRLNIAILLPILLWPFVFYSTLFFFDHPSNLSVTYLMFFAINIYPIYLLVISYYNTKLFKKNRVIGSILPIAIFSTLVVFLIYILFSMGTILNKSIKRDVTRNKQGYIGVNYNFKIIDNKVYYKDSLIVGADAKTFEIVAWNWQRDKNFYYYFGKKISYIDRSSFEDLGYHYGKDKLNVYYDEKIIEGADTKTFFHIEGSQDGKDKLNCYRWGKKVDCEILKTEY